MKRILAIVCTIFTIFSFNGCKPAALDTSTDVSTQASIISAEDTIQTEIPSNTKKPMVAVSVPTVTEVTTSDAGTEIFRYVYQNMALILPEQDVADKVIIDFLNRIDQSLSPADDIRQQALSAYNGQENWIPHLYALTYNPTRIDQGVLSLYGTSIVYSGSAHPSYDCVSVSYDLITGNVLTLGSILAHENVLSALETLVLEKLNTIEEEKFLRADYKDTIHTRFAGEESYDEDWFFTSSGLCFYFPPYEIAPYSSGIIVIEIAYQELTGILDDSFFPAEQDTVSNEVIVKALENVDLTEFSQIGELILNNAGDVQLLLYTNDSLQHPKIKVTDPSTGESYIAFASQSLLSGDAIMIKTTQDNLKNIAILFDDNGTTKQLPIIE